MGPRVRVSFERLEKPGIKPTNPGLEGKQHNHYATEASAFERLLAFSAFCSEAVPLSWCFV